MKNYLLSAALIFCSFLQAQDYEYTLGLDFYQPIRFAQMGPYYLDDWSLSKMPASLPEETYYARKDFSGAFGINYQRKLKNQLILKTRVGVSMRALSDTAYVNFHEQQGTGPDDYVSGSHSKYRQQHLNLFFGLARTFPVFEKLDLIYGIDLAYIHYFEGTLMLRQHNDYYQSSQGYGYDEIWNTTVTGPCNIFGLGPDLNLRYSLTKHIGINVGVQEFLSYWHSKGTISNSYYKTAIFQSTGSFEVTETETTSKQEIGKFGWSGFSPLVTLDFKF